METKLREVKSPLEVDQLYIAPSTHLSVLDEPNRPQPKLDVFRSNRTTSAGMTVHCGRLRSNERDFSAYVLVHNTLRGGAGGSVLNAEYALQQGTFRWKSTNLEEPALQVYRNYKE